MIHIKDAVARPVFKWASDQLLMEEDAMAVRWDAVVQNNGFW